MAALAADLKQAHGIACTVIAQDLAAPGGVPALVAQLQALRLAPDVLVNNAGLGTSGPHHRNAWADEQQMIDLNITALTALTHALVPAMVERKQGKILNVASTAAFQAGPGMAVYFATKAYVLSYSEALHEELRHVGISVTALCPGPTRSEFFDVAFKSARPAVLARVPMASTADVARYGLDALMRGQAVAVQGLLNRLGVWSIRFTPRSVVRRIITALFKTH
jgi:short-subunit dehydrogenase